MVDERACVEREGFVSIIEFEDGVMRHDVRSDTGEGPRDAQPRGHSTVSRAYGGAPGFLDDVPGHLDGKAAHRAGRYRGPRRKCAA